jgi:hypothetical protein
MDWPMFRRVERQATRLKDMMDRLDVDPVALARLKRGQAYQEAQAACLFCRQADRCLAWLDFDTAAEPNPEFCPNASVLMTCKRKDPNP